MASFQNAAVTGGRTARSSNTKAKSNIRRDPLASLKMASMLQLKPVLPLELISAIVDQLDVPDLMRFARVSRRMSEMVYEDSRWVARLRRMGVWDEEAARRREEQHIAQPAASISGGSQVNGSRRQSQGPVLVGADPPNPPLSGGRRRSNLISALREDRDGFDAVPLASTGGNNAIDDPENQMALVALRQVHSIRGKARQEFGKVYKLLGPYYNDIGRVLQPMSARVFSSFSLPEQQAQMLAQLRVFSKSDGAVGAEIRTERLMGTISVFEAAALQELRRGYESKDFRGRMKRYAQVLATLDAEPRSIETYIQNSRLISQNSAYGDPGDTLDYSSGHGTVSLEKTQMFFNRLGIAYSEEEGIIDHGFPSPGKVKPPLVLAIGKDVLGPYLAALLDEAHGRGMDTYLKTVSGTFVQTRQFLKEVSGQTTNESFISAANEMVGIIFEPHMDLYLGAELTNFNLKSSAKVDDWDKALSEQSASTETFLMSNINRQADKKDFLTSFKKVVMMPVNILPSFPSLSSSKPAAKALVDQESFYEASRSEAGRESSESGQWTPHGSKRSSTPVQEAPTTELAAKAAIMSSNMEGIRSLFSIEVALDLVHMAKAGLERVAQFTYLGGQAGEDAKTQCSEIFLALLYILGTRHVKSGFDKAVSHLSAYHPREVDSHEPDSTGVQPLTTFLELVNIADLIQQMLDVFYEQELIGPPVSLDRSDFLSPAVKEKKKFEQMLDERVAAGLSKGIDVLMDEVEYICATTQLPTDYNSPDTGQISDVGTTDTARQVIKLVSGHTSMLAGATEKSLLDVFNGEVGLRLFATLCKHLKRQRVSTMGSLRLIADMNAYYAYIQTLRNPDLLLYFGALRELGQIYLIDERDAEDMAGVIAEGGRWRGVFRAEEVLDFAERRADWFTVKPRVERGLYGKSCVMM